MSKALSSWFGFSLCILGYFCANNNPALAEARLALEKETLSEGAYHMRSGILSDKGISFRTPSLLAQVTSDDTVNTQVTENGNTAEITGGETRGDNLFHSFQDFSVGAGNEAAFLNANDIANIFSRVTGGEISNIDGLISANGSANLFLINPAGIVFGEGARLDIGGSFYGSSASSILFEDGEFSAADLENPPVLTINAPIGLGFRDQPGDIVNRSIADDGLGLAVATGNNLTLLGGNIRLQGGNISAPGGRVELGGLTAEGIIGFDDNNGLNIPQNISRGNVSLTQGALIDVTSSNGGFVTVNANNLEILDGSAIIAGIGEGLGTLESQAGDITLDVAEQLTLRGEANTSSSGINNSVNTNGLGNAGDIIINTASLEGIGNFILGSATFGQGNAGKIVVTASENVSFAGLEGFGSGIGSAVADGATGNGNDIIINTSSLSSNQALIATSTIGEGNAGNIAVNATDSISLSNGSSLQAATFGDVEANGGNIEISTANLSLTDGSLITGSTFAQGDAGFVTIDADNISVDGVGNDGTASGVVSTVGSTGVGDAGGIDITTSELSLTNGGQVEASTFGQGDAGFVTIDADNISADGVGSNGFASGTFSNVEEEGEGNAGNILVDTKNLSLTNGAVLASSTFSKGNAGNITINATDISFDGVDSGTFSNVNEGAVGNGGELKITTANLSLSNDGGIFASTLGEGDGGTIDIDAIESITLDGGGILNVVDRGAVGNGGELKITTANLSLSNNSIISTTILGEGDGGSISINSTDIVLTKNTFIDASNFGKGNGGSVFVKADTLSLNDGTISASNFSSESPTANADPKAGGNINLEIAKSLSLDNDSNITALASGNANGGNVDINANFIVAFPDGDNDITAFALQGRGGNIRIASEGIFGIEERPLNDLTNDINASSNVFGFDGTVNINTSDINPVQGASELPSNVVEPEQTAAQTCEAGRGTAQNSFAIAGKGGVPPAPDAPLNSENIIVSAQSPAASTIPQPIETSQGKIQPARGIKVTESGKIVLTAYRTNSAGERIPEIKPNCNSY